MNKNEIFQALCMGNGRGPTDPWQRGEWLDVVAPTTGVPKWVQKVVYLANAGSIAWPVFARRLVGLAARWQVLDDAAWRRCEEAVQWRNAEAAAHAAAADHEKWLCGQGLSPYRAREMSASSVDESYDRLGLELCSSLEAECLKAENEFQRLTERALRLRSSACANQRKGRPLRAARLQQRARRALRQAEEIWARKLGRFAATKPSGWR